MVCLFRRRDISSSLNSLADSNARECPRPRPPARRLRPGHVLAGVSPGSMPKAGCEIGGGTGPACGGRPVFTRRGWELGLESQWPGWESVC